MLPQQVHTPANSISDRKVLAHSLYQPKVIRQCHTDTVGDSATTFMCRGSNEPRFLTPIAMTTTSQIRCAKKTSVLRKTAPLKVTFRVLTLHRLSPRLLVSQNEQAENHVRLTFADRSEQRQERRNEKGHDPNYAVRIHVTRGGLPNHWPPTSGTIGRVVPHGNQT